MNPITHLFIALELFKKEKLTDDELDHLIVGSILPDINQSGLIHYHRTHYNALDFFNSTTNKLHKLLALGMVLHGEEPKGVDYYAHEKNGFIENNREEIKKIARKYHKYIGKANSMTAHYLAEFSADNILAKRNPHLLPLLFSALKNPKIKKGITAFSTYCGLTERKNRKIISLLRNKHLLHFFKNFATTETTSRSWVNFTFFMNLKKGRNLTFKERVKKLTRFSYFNIKRKLHNREVIHLFEEINLHLEQPTLKFVYETTQKLLPLKNELKKHLC